MFFDQKIVFDIYFKNQHFCSNLMSQMDSLANFHFENVYFLHITVIVKKLLHFIVSEISGLASILS